MLNTIDLFSGCGGLTDGFLKTGSYKTLAAIDWEKSALETLRNRLVSKWGYGDNISDVVIHYDLQDIKGLIYGFDNPEYGQFQGLTHTLKNKSIDVIIGGPPCQAYSIAGRVRDSNGMKFDYRNYLFESYVKIVETFKPRFFIFENVEGILSAKPGDVLITRRITEAFSKIGYTISSDLRNDALFDLSDFGIPQKRKRVIIFGVKEDESQLIQEFYSQLRSRKIDKPSTSWDHIKDLPKLLPTKVVNSPKISHIIEEGKESISNHEPRYHNPRDIGIFKILTKDIISGRNKYRSTQALIELYKEKTGKVSKFHKYNVIRRDLPSNTIPAHLYKDGLRHIHPDPEQARSITVREAARLQGFDDDFIFYGSRGDQYKMIGNAVPPMFSKILAEVILYLSKNF